MAGIYIHIPFCKQACHYCDFHFSTNFRAVSPLMEAIKKEVGLQAHFFGAPPSIRTIYFGGGTPSAVSPAYIGQILEMIHHTFAVDAQVEVTLETNPDDLLKTNLAQWKSIGINRLSVGVQSFFDEHLRWMNRAHNSQQALTGLKLAQDMGLENITMDLIYGIPEMTPTQWQTNLDTFFELKIPHLSAYGLTIEENTHLGHLHATHKVKAVADKVYNEQFTTLMQMANAHGMEHYEISNFAQPNFISQHNSAYWKGVPYLGIGPSAHSFNGAERLWNVASNKKYTDAILKGNIPQEKEVLSVKNHFNEYVMTRLRTKWGLELHKIKRQFGVQYQNYLVKGLAPFVAQNLVEEIHGAYVLTTKGKYMADKIASDLFWV